MGLEVPTLNIPACVLASLLGAAPYFLAGQVRAKREALLAGAGGDLAQISSIARPAGDPSIALVEEKTASPTGRAGLRRSRSRRRRPACFRPSPAWPASCRPTPDLLAETRSTANRRCGWPPRGELLELLLRATKSVSPTLTIAPTLLPAWDKKTRHALTGLALSAGGRTLGFLDGVDLDRFSTSPPGLPREARPCSPSWRHGAIAAASSTSVAGSTAISSISGSGRLLGVEIDGRDAAALAAPAPSASLRALPGLAPRPSPASRRRRLLPRPASPRGVRRRFSASPMVDDEPAGARVAVAGNRGYD